MPRLAFSKYLLAASSALALTLSASVAARASSFDTSRPVGFPGFNAGNATASPDGQVYGFAAETGYALHSDLQSNPLTVTPLAGLGYTHLHADGFTESGGSAADLAVSGSDVDSFTTSFGARASTRIDAGANGVLVPEAHAIWQREFLDDRAKVGAAFAVAPGSGFTVVSNRFGTNTGLVGIGITQEASADVKIFVNYDAQIQNSFASHTISAGLRVRFN
jgi:outer membrane autotransporter protein